MDDLEQNNNNTGRSRPVKPPSYGRRIEPYHNRGRTDSTGSNQSTRNAFSNVIVPVKEKPRKKRQHLPPSSNQKSTIMSVNPLGTIDSSESTGIINRTEQNVEPHQNYGSTPSTNNANVGSRPKPGLQKQISTRNAFKLISKHDLDLQRYGYVPEEEIINISEQQQERNEFSKNATLGQDEPILGYPNGYTGEHDIIDNNSEGDDDGLFFTCADILVAKINAYFRHYIFDEENPEFTSLQSFVWAIFIGVFMGIYTAKWGELIEFSVDIVWEKVPSYLVEKGIFTDVDGHLPLPHYMWITPAIFSGILSYVTVKLPCQIPGQNEWIDTLHRKGIMVRVYYHLCAVFIF